MEEPLSDDESVVALPEAHGVAVEHGEPDGDRVTLFVKLGDIEADRDCDNDAVSQTEAEKDGDAVPEPVLLTESMAFHTAPPPRCAQCGA